MRLARADEYICKQCFVWGYPDCKYEFHPEDANDNWKQRAEEVERHNHEVQERQ